MTKAAKVIKFPEKVILDSGFCCKLCRREIPLGELVTGVRIVRFKFTSPRETREDGQFEGELEEVSDRFTSIVCDSCWLGGENK